MDPISVTVASPSCFSLDEGQPSPPRQSVGDLMSWFSSEVHLFLSTNNVRAPIAVPSPAWADTYKGQEPAHANDHQGDPEPGGITTSTTAIIPFSGRAVPTMVILSLVPLHLGTGQYPPSLNPSSPLSPDKGGEPSLFRVSPSHPSEPSHLSVDYQTGSPSDIRIDPQYSEYAPTPDGFPIAPRNPIPHYQPPGHGDLIQEPKLDGSTAAAIASRGHSVAVYPPSFDQVPRTCLISDHPLSPSPVNQGVIPLAHTTYQTEGNGQSTCRQTYRDAPRFPTNTAGTTRGGGANQHPSRHQCTICDASYARSSGLNRHYKDKHRAWMACRRCDSEFSLGRMYKFTEHLQTCPGA